MPEIQALSLVTSIQSRYSSRPLLDSFLEGRNARTIRAYLQDLTDFASFLEFGDVNKTINFLVSITGGGANGIVLAYRAHMTTRGMKSATINRRLASLRSIVKLARTLGLI